MQGMHPKHTGSTLAGFRRACPACCGADATHCCGDHGYPSHHAAGGQGTAPPAPTARDQEVDASPDASRRSGLAHSALALALADPEGVDPWEALEHELESADTHGPFADGPWDPGVPDARW